MSLPSWIDDDLPPWETNKRARQLRMLKTGEGVVDVGNSNEIPITEKELANPFTPDAILRKPEIMALSDSAREKLIESAHKALNYATQMTGGELFENSKSFENLARVCKLVFSWGLVKEPIEAAKPALPTFVLGGQIRLEKKAEVKEVPSE